MFNATSAILFTGRCLEVAYLAPLAAAGLNQRSTRYQHEPWMLPLAVTVAFSVVVRATLMGTALWSIRNHWVSNFALFPGYLLMIWVLAGLRPRGRTGSLLLAAGLPIAAMAAWEASHAGFNNVWNHSATLVAIALLAACLWEIYHLFLLEASGPLWSIPAFWLLSAWALDNSTALIFHTMFDFFLATLKKPWVLVPWLFVFILGAVFNFILAKAFLCLKPRSS